MDADAAHLLPILWWRRTGVKGVGAEPVAAPLHAMRPAAIIFES
jgi:hypothetical protein